METCYILNPDYTLKNDSKRVILYARRHVENGGAKGWLSYLHPIQAMIFSFFTHKRSFIENVNRIALLTGKNEVTITSFLQPFIENNESLMAHWENKHIMFPRNFLINAGKVKKEEDKYSNISIGEMECNSEVDISSKRIHTFPLIYTFMLTNKCVTQCKYCYADTKTKVKKELSTNRILELLKESYELGVQNVNLIGGEVFLRNDWDIILSELIKYGYEPDILSTKYPLTKDMINRLQEINYRNPIQVSLDSLDDQILHDSLCVKKGYADKIKESIQLLDASSLNYQISTVLTRYNASGKSLLQLHNFILTLTNIANWDLRLAMDSLYKDFEKMKLSRGEAMQVWDFVNLEIKPKATTKVEIDISLLEKKYFSSEEGSKSFEGARCSALNTHMFILPDGQVTICEQLYWNPNFIIGDISENSIKEVWNSSKVKALLNLKQEQIQQKSSCKSCNQFQKCFSDSNRCWADIIKAYGIGKWDFPDPRCNRAPSMKNNIAYI